jgi:hypothetical protein
MSRRVSSFKAILLLGLLFTGRVYALRSAPWATGFSCAEDLQIKLVTINPGPETYAWWGHTAIIVEDKRLNTARFYNYGLFSFHLENFYLNFAFGRLIFEVGASDAAWELAYYSRINREIRIQVLNLSPAKRMQMARFLENNILPENREYLYDHYFDNCSTRIRDLIDRMVDGELAAITKAPSPLTLREHTRRYTYQYFFMDWLLMFLMGRSIDQPINEWDEMFLPDELEKYVGRVEYRDEQGNIVPLVSDSYIHYKVPEYQGAPVRAPTRRLPGLLCGLVLAGAALTLALYKKRGSKPGRILYGFYNSLIGFFLGIPGLALTFLMFFTDHRVTYYNENLLLANPLTILAIPLGLLAAFDIGRSSSYLLYLWRLLAAAAILALVGKLFTSVDQENWRSLGAILPVLLALALYSPTPHGKSLRLPWLKQPR